MDLVFIPAYSFLMICIVSLSDNRIWGRVLLCTIILGALFDYLEDFSFARYLIIYNDHLPYVTACSTTLKCRLLAFNGIACLWMLIQGGIKETRAYTNKSG